MQGWDKTYCLQFVEKEYDEIHFFGDKTFEARPLWARHAGAALSLQLSPRNQIAQRNDAQFACYAVLRMLQVSLETPACC